jgi:hypothetical protein
MGIQLLDASGNALKMQADGSARINPRPVNVGALGSYSATIKSGIMAAGLGAAAPVLAFLWKPATVTTSLALIRRIKFSAWNLGTGFTAGNFLFDFLVARAFTVQDTGGGAATLTTNNAKLRTSFATTQAAIQASTTATLSAGTRTLDANPLRSLAGVVANAAFAAMLPDTEVFRQQPGEWPLTLAGTGEGFVIQATVPATGTWTFGCAIDWDEVASTEI